MAAADPASGMTKYLPARVERPASAFAMSRGKKGGGITKLAQRITLCSPSTRRGTRTLMLGPLGYYDWRKDAPCDRARRDGRVEVVRLDPSDPIG